MVTCGLEAGNGCAGFGAVRILQSVYNPIEQTNLLIAFFETHPNFDIGADPTIQSLGAMESGAAQALMSGPRLQAMLNRQAKGLASEADVQAAGAAYAGAIGMLNMVQGGLFKFMTSGGNVNWSAIGKTYGSVPAGEQLQYTETARDAWAWSEQSAKDAVAAINVTPSSLAHIIARHTIGGSRAANRSTFSLGVSLYDLISAAENTSAQVQHNGNLQRVVNAGVSIGVDRATNLPTSIYTVITNPSGFLVTMFPGLP